MGTDLIQVQYDELDKIAVRFGKEAEAAAKTAKQLRQSINRLQSGGWQGRGASAFFREMDEIVLPAVQRLADALQQSREVTQQVSQLMREAEEAAARPFREGGNGAPGEAGGGAGAGAGPNADSDLYPPTISTDQIYSTEYMDGLIGKTFQGADTPQLNQAMETLAGNPTPEQLDQALDQIAAARGLPREAVQAQYERYLQLRDAAGTYGSQHGQEPIGDVNQFAHDKFMGTTTQLRYGQVVGDALGVDPVFGALLNPTGGLVGPGNWAVDMGDAPLSYHGAVHDAAGYLYNYHGMGPGYNYLGVEDRDTSSPLSGQQSGIQYWNDRLGASGVGSTVSNSGGTVIGVAEDIRQGYSDFKDWLSDLF